MSLTIAEIAKIIDGEYEGAGDTPIEGASGIREARPGQISFLGNLKYFHLAETTQASCLIISKSMNGSVTAPCIRVDDPSLAFAKVVEHFSPNTTPIHPSGIHPTAIIEKSAKIGHNVSIGPYVIIDENVQIGDNTVIYPSVFIGHSTIIGEDSLIYPNASLREGVTIGRRVIIHNGAVIGSDGFGFATVQGVHHKIPQVGTVVIHDDVEIGANVTIDRARFGKTVIGRGTKIDNLVQIAHNVEIGEGTIIVAQAGVSGSTKIGKNAILAGQAGIIGHLNIGDNVIIGAGSGVIRSVESDQVVLGSPAKPHQFAKRIFACIDKLPDLFKKIAGFEKRIEKIESENEWKSKPPLKSTSK